MTAKPGWAAAAAAAAVAETKAARLRLPACQ